MIRIAAVPLDIVIIVLDLFLWIANVCQVKKHIIVVVVRVSVHNLLILRLNEINNRFDVPILRRLYFLLWMLFHLHEVIMKVFNTLTDLF